MESTVTYDEAVQHVELMRLTGHEPIPGALLRKIDIDEIMPAPPEWNFFETQSDAKIADLAVSLLTEGQMTPIILRRHKDENHPGKKYQCLTGHTRILAAKALVEQGHTDWKYLAAFFYPAENCDDTKARRIIVYSNTKQRLSLTPTEKRKCFIFDYLDSVNADRKQKTAEITNQLAQKYKLKRSQAYNLRNIGTKLIPAFTEQVLTSKITTNQAVILASLEQEVQEHLAANFMDRLGEINLRACKKKSCEEIDQLFAAKEDLALPALELEFTKDKSSFDCIVALPAAASQEFIAAMKKLYDKYGVSKTK